LERATGIEPVLPTWESKLSILYFQYLQNRSERMYVHALHTVHALPDLRTAGGRLGDGFYDELLFATADFRLTFSHARTYIFGRYSGSFRPPFLPRFYYLYWPLLLRNT